MVSSILNNAQQSIVRHLEGPVLVIAGPGSGKTKTLVERVIYMFKKGIEPQNIMVATFTEKAAKELVTRISNRMLEDGMKVNLNEMYVGTLHSIFLRFLEEHKEFTRLKRNYKVLDSFEQQFYIFRNISSFSKVSGFSSLVGEHNYNYWNQSQVLAKEINRISEELIDVEALKSSNYEKVRALAECYEIYQSILSEENALDFSTIQSEIYNLFINKPTILGEIQEKIKYFMVDEYQDTNTVQEKVMLLLAQKYQNLCVVGDDDQGLYRFRGATIRNILEFASNFPQGVCTTYYLETNYRSHPDIISFYNKWMQHGEWVIDNQHFRFDKTIQPCDRSFEQMKTVVKLSSDVSVEVYHEEVYKFITILQKHGIITNLNQIAFLFRSVKNPTAVGLMEYLESKGIRVFSPRSDMFFNREEIRLILGCLVVLFPTFDACVRNQSIIDECSTMREEFLNTLRENAEHNRKLVVWLSKLSKVHADLQTNTNYAFTTLIYQLFQFPLFAKYLDVDMSANKNDLRPTYNIGILTSLVSRFEELYNINVITPNNIEKVLHNFFDNYLRFLIDGGLEEYEDFDETLPSDCISFMTIHQSKGLEFPITVVGSLYDNPRKSYTEMDEIMQESYYHKPIFEPLNSIKYFDFDRLYYTAFSRAQNLLVLSGYEHGSHNRVPSKAFDWLWNDIPSWDDTKQFDYRKLKLAEVNAANIKHEYAFTSHILLYESCPLQYKFYKELGFAEIRTGSVVGGNLLHETIEDIHRAVLRGEEQSLTDSNIRDWFDTNYRLLVKLHHTYLRQEQQDAIFHYVLNYRNQNKGKWNQIREAEVDVSLVKDEYILKGTIDLIKGVDDTVELVDFKSGDKPDVNTTDPHKRKILNQYRRQLEVYAHIVEQRTGLKVSKMHIYYPKEENANPRISFSYNSDNVATTIKNFDEVVHKIETKDYSMNGVACNEKQCRECDMRFYCNKY